MVIKKSKIDVDKLVVMVGPETTIDATVIRMAEKRHPQQIDGIAVITDDDRKILGVLTDGDIRRAYAKRVDFQRPVKEIMVRDPITVQVNILDRDILSTMVKKISQTNRLRSKTVRYILVVDAENRLVQILDVTDQLFRQNYQQQKVAIYGMGHVGLTLAVTLANLGHQVKGIEKNPKLAAELSDAKTGIFEPGLSDMLGTVVKNRRLEILTENNESQSNIHIVAVGSPVDKNEKPDVRALKEVGQAIAAVLKPGDQVYLRSTVPVGFSRQVFVPLLEEVSGLKAKMDFCVAFTPERTVEGRALNELRTLPQVVGGLSDVCTDRAATFWSSVTSTVVRTPSIESAEIVKIANNTFRDLCFAFSNELALLCNEFNLNAFRVIEAANEGYPRNLIPSPSPGVGGYCLTKDPYLYQSPWVSTDFRPTLGVAGRKINDMARDYPLSILSKWSERQGKPVTGLKVLAMGLAFKGQPETADLRSSTAVEVSLAIQGMGASVMAWDAVVGPDSLRGLGFEVPTDLSQALADAEAIFILNNHPSHSILGIVRSIARTGHQKLIFDGWHQLDFRELEQLSGVTYATMGYMTSHEL